MRSSKSPGTDVTSACSIEGCGRTDVIPSRGWCRKHYQRWRNQGDPTVALRDRDHGGVCSSDSCDRPVRARRLCEAHWRKAYPPDPSRPISDEVRSRRDAFFWANIVQDDDGCWIWQRSLGQNGYGQMRGYRRAIGAHRFGYELLVGLIPDDMDIDHLCKIRACCNPGHLEIVTRAENLRRSDQSRPSNRGRLRPARSG